MLRKIPAYSYATSPHTSNRPGNKLQRPSTHSNPHSKQDLNPTRLRLVPTRIAPQSPHSNTNSQSPAPSVLRGASPLCSFGTFTPLGLRPRPHQGASGPLDPRLGGPLKGPPRPPYGPAGLSASAVSSFLRDLEATRRGQAPS